MKLQNMDEAQRIGKDTTAFMPIVQSLNTLSEEEHKKFRMKFNTAYFVAVEQLEYQSIQKYVNYNQNMVLTWVIRI